jgi:hypothetical protein
MCAGLAPRQVRAVERVAILVAGFRPRRYGGLVGDHGELQAERL